ncbi:hypothetical protein [Paenibacillus luteus]|uniref:hypothetical protein n=1 Tax=Paenibacillus luteus TaxID=2545753 RepID=UPI0019D59644|nr:hypothetical protein [Paenibacillus luteus]
MCSVTVNLNGKPQSIIKVGKVQISYPIAIVGDFKLRMQSVEVVEGGIPNVLDKMFFRMAKPLFQPSSTLPLTIVQFLFQP